VTYLLERVRYLAAIGVVGLVALAVAAFVWGGWETLDLIATLVRDGWGADDDLIELLGVIDIYLLATVLLILAIGLWELFVSDLDVPDWLTVRSLDDLKKSLIDVLVVFVAVKGIEKLASSGDPDKALRYVIAVAVLILSLTAFRLAKTSKPAKPGSSHAEGKHPAEG
jgi:uncharacterized membrane protein YqhA